MGLTANQCRAARAWLRWTQHDLAQRCEISAETVRHFEAGRTTSLIPVVESAIVKAFEDAGIMLDAEGKMVRGE